MNSAGIEQSRILDPKGYILEIKGVFFKNKNMEGFFGAQKLIKGKHRKICLILGHCFKVNRIVLK